MKRFPAIIAYDIQSNKQRRKVFKCLQAWSLDSQYSLFECLLSQKEAEELFIQITDLINPETDTLLLAWIDKARKAEALTKNTQISFKTPSIYIS